MKQFLNTLRAKLAQLSFRTGVVVLLACVPFYLLSFAQMALDIDVRWKGVLWWCFSDSPKRVNIPALPSWV